MNLFTTYIKIGDQCGWMRWLALSFMLSFSGVAAFATTVIPPQFDDLVSQADYTVHAVVKSVRSEWRSKGANLQIVTKVELEVKEIIAGNPPSPLIIEMLGGKVGDQQMIVHGAPEFHVGDEDILFVHGNGVQMNPLVALGHGRYPIKRDEQSGATYMTRSNGDLLYDEREVSKSLDATATHQARTARALPLTPGAFSDKIRESRKNHPSARAN